MDLQMVRSTYQVIIPVAEYYYKCDIYVQEYSSEQLYYWNYTRPSHSSVLIIYNLSTMKSRAWPRKTIEVDFFPHCTLADLGDSVKGGMKQCSWEKKTHKLHQE